jgi:hypothetical protein
MTTSEPYDLNEKLADFYMSWQATYLQYMSQPVDETQDHYTGRMCCIAFMEGAKTVQLLMQQALMDTLAEQSK